MSWRHDVRDPTVGDEHAETLAAIATVMAGSSLPNARCVAVLEHTSHGLDPETRSAAIATLEPVLRLGPVTNVMFVADVAQLNGRLMRALLAGNSLPRPAISPPARRHRVGVGLLRCIARKLPWTKRLRFGFPRSAVPAAVLLLFSPSGSGKTDGRVQYSPILSSACEVSPTKSRGCWFA